jgi:UDP-N-acetylmuramoyl-tripeptide--D-alanyl-D-alanine ligase
LAQDIGGRVERGDPATIVTGVSTDSRTLADGELFVALRGPTFDGHAFVAAAASRGAAAALIAHDATPPDGTLPILRAPSDTVRALGELAHAHRKRMNARVVAITGSAGKTTTKEMIASILSLEGKTLATRGNLNNWIGVPLTVFGLEASHRFAVIEMGMSTFGEIARLAEITSPDVGLITLVAAAHTAELGGIDGVLRAKAELFDALGHEATAVVNLDDPRIASLQSSLRSRVLTFGSAPECDVRIAGTPTLSLSGTSVEIFVQGELVRATVPLLGAHQARNMAAAIATALALEVAPDRMLSGLASTPTVAGRMYLRHARGLTILDDTYNANPESMAAALETLSALASQTGSRAIAILADMRELGAESQRHHLGIGRLAAARALALYTLGAESRAIARGAREAGLTHVVDEVDIEPLREVLRRDLRPGDLVLVKGSRGMRMERIVAALTGESAEGGH